MQKKFLCAAAAAVGLLWGSLGFSYGEMTVAVMAGDLEVNAEAAVVMDADSGRGCSTPRTRINGLPMPVPPRS